MMMKMKTKTVREPSLLFSLIILLGAGGVICSEHSSHPAGSAAGHGGHAAHDSHREGHSLSAEPSEEESF